MVHNYMGHVNNFLPAYLNAPKCATMSGMSFEISSSATLKSGTVHACDIVVLKGSRAVAEVVDFWDTDGDIVVRLKVFAAVDGDTTLWKAQRALTCMSVNDIVEAIPYYSPFIGYIRTAPILDCYN